MPWATKPSPAPANVTSRPVLFQLPLFRLPVTLATIGVAHAVALPGVFSNVTVTSTLWIVTLVVVVLVIVHGNDPAVGAPVIVQLTAKPVPMQFWNPAAATCASELERILTSNVAAAHVHPKPPAVLNNTRLLALGESRTVVAGNVPPGSTNQLAADATPGNANAHNDRTPAKSKTLFFDNFFIIKLLVSPSHHSRDKWLGPTSASLYVSDAPRGRT
jgi:hypothetical protein